MKAKKCILVIIGFCWFSPLLVFGQTKSPTHEKYIQQYCDLAMYHQKKYAIPASIKLAQGLLETGAGTSKLARNANNHFGIKCHSDWKGERVYLADDTPNDCFRKYNTVEESFEDHSLFLKRAHYSRLFNLEITDYTGWARGLQECGYATDKTYASKLINLIETYKLQQYDTNNQVGTENIIQSKPKRDVYKTFNLIYVIAKENDSFEAIAHELGFKAKKLIQYNDVPAGFPLRKGDVVYLEKKKKRADHPHYEHIVQVGESMHSISQRYGLQLSSLYKMNTNWKEYVPREGDVLRLR